MILILSFMALGVLAGILSGLIGIGGGVILVPALVYFFGFNQHHAQGTSLAILLLPLGILAVWVYYKQGAIDLSALSTCAAQQTWSIDSFCFSRATAGAAKICRWKLV